MAVEVGIVGLGTWGTWHAGRLRQLPGFKLRSVCDITPERRQAAKRDFGCPAYANLNEFLADDRLQLVIVATPSHAHETPVVAALRAGKHVLCEKPLAQTEAAARRMFTAAQRARRTLMTFQNRRGDADFLTAKKVVDSGRLGRLLDIRLVHWGWTDVMRKFGVKSFRPGWRTEAAYGGGTLLDFGPHHFDQLLQIVRSPIESVYADLRGRRWTKDADDQFLAILRTAEGTVVQLEYSQNSHVPVHVNWAINGTDAGFRYEEKQSFLYSHSTRGREKVSPVKNVPADWDRMHQNIRAVVAGRADPLVQPRETLRVMRVLDAIRRSAQSGRVVTIQDEYAP
jgi:scyllo-inositol 2-dehydrogenase (NADP+)